MKRKKYSIYILFALILLQSSCETDNMDAPSCHIIGKMCYQGNAIGVRGSGQGDQTNASVQLELWQAGFGKETALNVNVTQDGTFSTYIYPGEIRLITKSGVGPWENADTLRATVKGNMTIDYEVKPYFTISNVNYAYNAKDSILSASFHVEKIANSAIVKSLGILVNNTQFVDLSHSKSSSIGSGQIGDVSFSLDCKSLSDCKCLFARVYVKSDMSNDAVYSITPYRIW